MEFSKTGYGLTNEAQEYWSTHRSKISDLYRSEKHFFVKVLPEIRSVLDLGCAAGGSLLFSRELNPTVGYTGVDISPELVLAAQNRFKTESNVEFLSYDGTKIPKVDSSVDFCFSFGVFHHLPDWKWMAGEFLRVSSRYSLFDLRVWEESSLINDRNSFQKIALGEEWDGKTVVPYNIQSFNEVFNFCSNLLVNKVSTKLFGYYSRPTSLAITPAEKVLMLAVLFEKNVEKPTIELLIEN